MAEQAGLQLRSNKTSDSTQARTEASSCGNATSAEASQGSQNCNHDVSSLTANQGTVLIKTSDSRQQQTQSHLTTPSKDIT
jgi:hypothetical protein